MTTVGTPIVIEANSVPSAWLKVFKWIKETSDSHKSPVIVSITDFADENSITCDCVQEIIDTELGKHPNSATCEDTAFTIFPNSFWNKDKSVEELFSFYERAYPRLKKLAQKKCTAWGRGTYFCRLIAPQGETSKNQLLHIINKWNAGNHNSMLLQASCYDPVQDQTNSRRLSFPCLQQIGFCAQKDEATNEYNLWINAFYPTQNIFTRGYGNYLGLCRLGQFMAHYMNGCRFSGINCFSGNPTISPLKKSAMPNIIEKIEDLIPNNEVASL